MNNSIYDDVALEQIAKQRFGVSFDVDHVIVRDIPVSNVARATVFLTAKKQLYAYIHGPSNLLLADVKKIISRLGLTAELYLPPKGQPRYFDDIAQVKFSKVYPGHKNPSDDDLRYYQTLAPYNPGLVQILEVKDGHVYRYDADAKNNWRVETQFAYRRIRTS